jgi:hypothetical protein
MERPVYLPAWLREVAKSTQRGSCIAGYKSHYYGSRRKHTILTLYTAPPEGASNSHHIIVWCSLVVMERPGVLYEYQQSAISRSGTSPNSLF